MQATFLSPTAAVPMATQIRRFAGNDDNVTEPGRDGPIAAGAQVGLVRQKGLHGVDLDVVQPTLVLHDVSPAGPK